MYNEFILELTTNKENKTMSLTIRTNNQYRLALYGYELPEKVKSDFDYVDDLDSETFLKYKGNYYWIGDFLTTSTLSEGNDLKRWDGYTSDSFFSGVLIKVSKEDQGTYLMAEYFVN